MNEGDLEREVRRLAEQSYQKPVQTPRKRGPLLSIAGLAVAGLVGSLIYFNQEDSASELENITAESPINQETVEASVQGKDIKEEISNHENPATQNPIGELLLIGLGAAKGMMGDLDGELECYRKTLETDPNSSPTYCLIGGVLEKQGDLEGAIEHYRKGVELDPNFAEAHNGLGVMLAKQGDVKGALASYNKAIELEPKQGVYYFNKGVALSKLGNTKKELALYKKALELNPYLAYAHNNIGVILEHRKDLAGALESYRKATELAPGNELFQKNFAKVSGMIKVSD